MRIRWMGAVVALLVLVAGFGTPALAQTTGSVEGTISDSSGAPLPGVSVELKSPSLQGTRTAVTDSNGHFRFPAIPPGSYTVTSTLSGFKSVERGGIRVTLDATATVLMKMEISVEKEIIVTGEAPVVDTTSNTSGLNIRQETVQKLPLGRNYASAVDINPGVARDTSDTQGRALTFTIYGATSIENQYLVDGVNTTNVIRGFQGKALNQEFVEEVQVKAGGYEAEYGRAMGGIINVVTKSGGNEFHGDVFGYFDRKSLTAASKERACSAGDAAAGRCSSADDTDENTIDNTQRNIEDYGVDVGGFMMKDRIWFFGAYNRVHQDVDQVPLANTGVSNAGKNFPISFASDLFSGKLTGRPTDSTTIVGTIFGDPEIREGTLRNFTAEDPFIQQGTRKIGATDFAVGVTQLFGTAGLANVRYSRHQDRYSLTGPASATPLVLDYRLNSNNPVASGGFGVIRGFRDNNKSRRDAVKADASFFFSTHEIKGGVDYEDNLTEATDYYSGGARLRIYKCTTSICKGTHAGDAQYYRHDFYTLTTDITQLHNFALLGGNTVAPRAYRLGFFLQDSWKVMPNLTVNAGIRYDQEDIRRFDGSEIFNDPAVDGTGKVIQQGGQTFKLKNEWQPRIGIAWDPMKDGSTKVSVSYGRFYYALPTDLTVRSYNRKIDATTFNFDPNPLALAQDPTIGRSAFKQGGVNNEPFQDDLKGIYQDEFALGFEKALDPSFSIGMRYTYRNFGRTIEDRCDFDTHFAEANGNGCVIINPGSDSPFSTGQGVHTCSGRDYGPQADPTKSDCTGLQTINVAVPAAERKFHGLELVLKKRVSTQLWMQASYLWSHLYGNYDGEASVGQAQFPGGGQTDPGINADYDYPEFTKYADGNLFLDHRHSFRFDAAYTTAFGLNVGLSTFLRSGSPYSKYGYINSGYVNEANFVSPRGSEGRLPWEFEINASLGYAIKLNPVTITLFASGFNLLNRQYTRGVEQGCTINPPTNDGKSDTGPGSIADCSTVTNPDGANPDFGKTTWRSSPRSIRLGARVSF